jgi:hypothetical protein
MGDNSGVEIMSRSKTEDYYSCLYHQQQQQQQQQRGSHTPMCLEGKRLPTLSYEDRTTDMSKQSITTSTVTMTYFSEITRFDQLMIIR